MHKLDQTNVLEQAAPYFANEESVKTLQIAVYVMCGGGFLGKSASEQPADFYIDSRVGKLPYGKREIIQAVETLTTLSKAAGFDPHNLPPMPSFHNCGIF